MQNTEKKNIEMQSAAANKRDITFRLATEGSEEVSVLLYKKGSQEVIREVPLEEHPFDGSVRSTHVMLDPAHTEYNFRAGGRVMQDPAARLIRGRDTFGDLSDREEHQVRCGFVTEDFPWEGDVPLRLPYEDVISYCLHVRGFTMGRQSGVRHKGTFRGLQEKIPYLNELGINQIILMPAYDFNEVMVRPVAGQNMAPAGAADAPAADKKLNYWGYTDGFFYAPKAGYSASRSPDLEFKEMVKALHRAGIELIMEFAFPDRKDICFMTDCLSWWIREYHVDGFFLLVRKETACMLAGCPQLKGVKLITGYYPAREVYPDGRKSRLRLLGSCNDGFKESCRRLLKGDEDRLGDFVNRMRQNEEDTACINYITNHDGFTLMDLVSYDKKHNEENGEQGRDGAACEYSWNCGVEGPSRKSTVQALRMRQMKNAFAMLLLAQGTPMLLAGDEFCNTQGGNNNPWCIDSPVTWLDWNKSKSACEMTEYVKKLIAFRKAHGILHPAAPLKGSDQTSCGYPDFSCHSGRAWYGGFEYQNRHIGMMFCSQSKEKEDFVYTAFNLHWDSQTFALPYLPDGMEWEIAFDTDGGAGEYDSGEAAVREFTLPGRSVRVLTGVRHSRENGKAGTPGQQEGKE